MITLSSYCIILSTCKDFKEAKKISLELLKKKLVACVNTIPIHSFYFWEDNIEKSKEQLLIIKTTWKLRHKVEKFIKKIHSYEIPEILTLKIGFGSKEYLNWVKKSVEK
ncbi:MAG: divalent-cation tolerance protein CutA [Candidatus Bathyarchaeia archaeon]